MPLCADALSLTKGVKALADGYLNFDTKINTKGMSEGLSKLGSLAKSACKTAVASIAAAGTALVGLASKAVQVGTSFEASMSQVAATMGITAQEIAQGSKSYEILKQAAKDAGAATKYSATEAADALNYLALAGYDASTAADVLPSVLNLAAASGMELAAASDLATDAMSALGIAASSENLTSFGDKLAKTASKSNTSVSQLGEAILTCAGTAKGFGMSTEALVTNLGVLANRGLKSAEAGTHLRNVILALESPTSNAAKELKRLGISVTNSDGSFRDLNDIIADLNKSMSKLTDEQRAQALSEIFNKTDLEAVNYLMAGLGDEYNNLYNEVSNCDGAMQDMADTMNDNLKGQVTILQSALEGLGIQVYEGLEKPLKSVVKECTEAVGRLSNAFTKGGFNGLTEALGGELAKAAAKVAEYSPKLVDAGVSLVLSLLDGVKHNSDRIANAGVEAGKAIVSGIVEVTPQIAAAGLEIMAALAKSLVGTQPAREIKKLANTVRKSFAEISSAVKSSVGTVKNLLGNLITIAAKVINAGIKPLTSAVVFITKHSKLFAVALTMTVTAMKAWKIATSVVSTIKKLSAAYSTAALQVSLFSMANNGAVTAQALATAGLKAHEIVVGVITGKIQLATVAQAAWNAITAANPFVLAAAALATLGAGIAAYCLMSDKATSSTDKYFDAVMQSLEGVDDFKETLDNAVPSLASYDSLLSASGKTISDLDNAIDTVETNITNILSKAVKDQKAIRDEDIENIRNYTQQLYDLEQEKLELYRSQQTAELRKIELEKGQITQEAAAQHIANLKETLDQSNQIVEDAYTAELTLIENKNNAGLYKDETAYKAALDAAKKSHDDRLAENQQFYDDGYMQIQDAAAKWGEANAQCWQEITDASTKYAEDYGGIWKYFNLAATSESQKAAEAISSMFASIDDESLAAASAMLQFAISTKDTGQQVSDSVKASTNTILSAFENLPESMQENGKEVLLGLIGGYESEIPALENAAEMSADEILTALRDYLDIEGGVSGEGKNIGKTTGDSVGTGLDASKPKIESSARSAAKTATDALGSSGLQTSAKSSGIKIGGAFAAGIGSGIASNAYKAQAEAKKIVTAAETASKVQGKIHSPSRLMRDEVGKPLADGIGVGIASQSKAVAKKAAAATSGIMGKMKAAVSAENAYTQGRAAVSNYNSSTTTNNYNSSTTNNQSLNFYQPIQTPSQVARAVRKAQEVS